MATSTKPYTVLAFPPSSIEELSTSLARTDNCHSFFNRDLCVVSKNADTDTHAPQEVVLAEIMNIFLASVKTTPLPQLKRFESAFLLYLHKINQGRSSHYHLLISSAQAVVKTEIALKSEGKEVSVANMLLITGEDEDAEGTMSIRIVESIFSNIPVMLSYRQLIQTIQGSFQLDLQNNPEKKIYLKNLRNAILKLSDPTQYKVYKHTQSPLIVLLPQNTGPFLNLEHYDVINFETILHDARLTEAAIPRDAALRQTLELFITHIIETLSTDVEKHIVWAGHGSLDKTALGLPLDWVHRILAQATHIKCWNLHSCYLLGNIRKILSHMQQPYPLIVINNGIVGSSHPLEEDASTATYFHLSSAISSGNTEKVLVVASPWINGFSAPNHPHLILEGSILPATIPGISTTLKQTDLQSHHLSYHGVERLYICTPHVTRPLDLSKGISILSGIAEINAHYLFSEIHTPSSLEEFIKFAFLSRSYVRPGVQSEGRCISKFTHHGHLVFMIKDLYCGWLHHYKGVIYISSGDRTFFCKSKHWYDIKNPHSPIDIQAILIQALLESRPFFTQEGFDFTFYRTIESTFHLPEGCLQCAGTVKQDPSNSAPTQESAEIVKELSPEQSFTKAVVEQDIEAISSLYSKMSKDSIIRAFHLCISTNLDRSFYLLLKLFKENLQEDFLSMHSISTSDHLILICIMKSRTTLLQIILSLGIKFPEKAIQWAIKYGDLATYNIVQQATSSTIDHKTLINTALKNENWDVMQALTSEMKTLFTKGAAVPSAEEQRIKMDLVGGL